MIGKLFRNWGLGLIFGVGLVSCTFATQTGPPDPQPSETDPPALIQLPDSEASFPDSETPSPIPTAIEFASPARQISPDGCCPYPEWMPDSQSLVVVHRGPEEQQARLYRVSLEGEALQALETPLGVFSPDYRYRAFPEGGLTYVEDAETGTRWSIPNAGREIAFSPQATFVVWERGGEGISDRDRRQSDIWQSNLDGSDAKRIVTLFGGQFIGWTADESALIVSGRFLADGPAGIWRVPLQGGEPVLLFTAVRPRGFLISPDGNWLAFTIRFDEEPRLNGLWVIRVDGSQARKLNRFGAYRWRSDGVMLVIPLDLDATSPALLQVDLAANEWQTLIDPKLGSISIANNDWQVSPDGEKLVFLDSSSRALWLLEFP